MWVTHPIHSACIVIVSNHICADSGFILVPQDGKNHVFQPLGWVRALPDLSRKPLQNLPALPSSGCFSPFLPAPRPEPSSCRTDVEAAQTGTEDRFCSDPAEYERYRKVGTVRGTIGFTSLCHVGRKSMWSSRGYSGHGQGSLDMLRKSLRHRDLHHPDTCVGLAYLPSW